MECKENLNVYETSHGTVLTKILTKVKGKKIKLFLQQAVESHWVVRRRGSNIF
jgi:hypothetical protein